MYILGLTTMGDAAASLLKDGKLIAAAEEERFSRRKHHSGFPWMAIEYCLSEAGITLKDVEHVALYWKPWVLGHKAWQALRTATLSWEMFQARIDRGVAQISESYWRMFKYPARLREHFGPSDFKFHYLDHHECHAASCFYPSSFASAAIFTTDGTGEATTTLFARGNGNTITPLDRIKLPHSLGQFYSSVTNFLGFDMFGGDEWKVMGLAAYGKPTYYDFFRNKVVTLDGPNKFRVHIDVLDHHLAKRYQFPQATLQALGVPRQPNEEISQRHMDIAASAQKVVEDTVLHLLNWLHKETSEENLCLAGGVVFNSVMNGRIMTESPFKKFYIQPAAGDAGCSLGAALLTWHRLLGQPRTITGGPSQTFQMESGYWGPKFSSEDCAKAIAAAGLKSEKLPDEILLPRVAKMIADGAIIGWFNGRMEFGPRALGSRSIIGDARNPTMQSTMNVKIKFRESFRPFAPCVLLERVQDCFEMRPGEESPYMLMVAPVRKELRRALTPEEERTMKDPDLRKRVNVLRSTLPAITHVDYSARVQTVDEPRHGRFYRLMKRFEQKTGCPVIVNTSFNIRGEPIVNTPQNALNCFLNTHMDTLVLNNLVLRKESQPARLAKQDSEAYKKEFQLD
jgi:carbamoyltransferase